MSKHMSDAAKSNAKMGFREPKLDSVRKLRGIFFIDPKDDVKGYYEQCSWKGRNSNASSDAL